MNKKLFVLSLMVVSLLVMAVPTVFADTTVTWGGSGLLSVTEQAGDDFFSQMQTGGTNIMGTYTLTDLENNPYGYGVDTVTAQLEGGFDNGGYIYFGNQRTDSWVPMYGVANEVSWTYIESDDEGWINFQTRGAYAELKSCNYGWHANDHFYASGNYELEHQLWDGDEGGYLYNVGSGTIDIDLMSESTWGTGESFQFGKGCGCYTNADVVATGTGTLTIYGQADNLLNVGMLPFSISGDGTPASATFTFTTTYGSGLTIPDISFDGN
jgi:hypothetical protein